MSGWAADSRRIGGPRVETGTEKYGTLEAVIR